MRHYKLNLLKVSALFFLVSCSDNQTKKEKIIHHDYVVFESKSNISQLGTVVLKVLKNNFASSLKEIVDTFNVTPISMFTENDTVWSFSINTSMIPKEILSNIEFSIELMELKKTICFTNIKVTKNTVFEGIFYSIDSFMCNGVNVENKMSNNGFDLNLE